MSLKIISTFGDHSSLIPIAAKDVTNSLGMTAFSYDAGGEIEAKDRFIDEFGTQAIWLGGLPFFKWAFDKTAYKAAKLNPNIDMRLVADKDQFKIASEYAKKAADELNRINNALKVTNPKIADKVKQIDLATAMADAGKNSKLFKNLFLGKFAAATALTLASFFTLVKVRQNYTEKQITKKFWEQKNKEAKESFYKNNVANSPAFKGFGTQNNELPVMKKGSKKSQSPSFKGTGSFLQSFMFDPVKNMFIVDAGITGERLGSARNKTEFAEYAIKEGSLLMFMYIAGRYVQKGIEYLSEKFLHKPVQLHAEVIASTALKDSIKSGSVHTDIAAFEKIANVAKDASKEQVASSNKAIYEFLYNEKNAENIVVKAAKKSGLVKVMKNALKKETDIINPHQFIDANEVREHAANIKKLAKKAFESGDIENFLKSCKNLKIGSVVGNIGISCLFLGLIVPLAMLKYREKTSGNKDYHVQREIQQRLENNFKARQA